MRYTIMLLSLLWAAVPFAGMAADPAPQKAVNAAPADDQAVAKAKAKAEAAAKVKAEAEAKARAEALAAQVGQDYAAAVTNLDKALKDNKIDEAVVAANAMIKLAGEPAGKSPWQPTLRTYLNVIAKFEDKKVFGAKHTVAFYEAALQNTTNVNDRADLLFQYGSFLNRFALVDEKKALDMMESAFNVPGITLQKQIQLCRKAGERDNWADLDRYAGKALALATNNPAAELEVYQWMAGGYGRCGRGDEVVPLYRKLLEDKTYESNKLRLASGLVSQLNRQKSFEESVAYLKELIPSLQGRDRTDFQRTLADTYKQSAARFYSPPDKTDMQLAIGIYRDILKDMPQDKPLDTVDTRLTIAELAASIKDYATVTAEVGQVLALPDVVQKRAGSAMKARYMLGQVAYAQGDYPKAVEILGALRNDLETMKGVNPDRRELVEMLVRSYCAVKDFEKAIALSDELLNLVRDHERGRYQAYISGLKQRVAPAN